MSSLSLVPRKGGGKGGKVSGGAAVASMGGDHDSQLKPVYIALIVIACVIVLVALIYIAYKFGLFRKKRRDPQGGVVKRSSFTVIEEARTKETNNTAEK